ncbi:MAG: acyl-ACP--UDP-N-acetylglucosamine O-acyltransferase [Candidatus Omnitrophota bacterium]
MKIHKTAIIHPGAHLEDNVEVGPYTVIGTGVKISKNTKIFANCVIEGDTTIGENCQIFSGAVIGSIPQDLKYSGEETKVVMGNNNIIREYVTINLGTKEKGITEIGDNNLLMAYAHIAHDCTVGSEVVIANCGTLAGHVHIDDGVIIGGLVAIHQFVHVGKLAIIGGCSKVVQDIPPYVMADGHPAQVYGLNTLGLKRVGVSQLVRQSIKTAVRVLFSSGLVTRASIDKLEKLLSAQPSVEEIRYLIEFVKNSKRGLCKSSWSKKNLYRGKLSA